MLTIIHYSWTWPFGGVVSLYYDKNKPILQKNKKVVGYGNKLNIINFGNEITASVKKKAELEKKYMNRTDFNVRLHTSHLFL